MSRMIGTPAKQADRVTGVALFCAALVVTLMGAAFVRTVQLQLSPEPKLAKFVTERLSTRHRQQSIVINHLSNNLLRFDRMTFKHQHLIDDAVRQRGHINGVRIGLKPSGCLNADPCWRGCRTAIGRAAFFCDHANDTHQRRRPNRVAGGVGEQPAGEHNNQQW